MHAEELQLDPAFPNLRHFRVKGFRDELSDALEVLPRFNSEWDGFCEPLKVSHITIEPLTRDVALAVVEYR